MYFLSQTVTAKNKRESPRLPFYPVFILVIDYSTYRFTTILIVFSFILEEE